MFGLGAGQGLMICGHGSRDQGAVDEFAELAIELRRRFAPVPVEYGYLEFARPIIRDGLNRLRAQGVREVLAVPGMLFAAGHAKNDIPSVLNTYQESVRSGGEMAGGRADPGFTIRYGRELGIDPRMLKAAGERVEAAIARADAARPATDPIPRHDTLLVVVGRGASDPDANSNVAKVGRMLWEGLGLGWAETAYSGVTFPLTEPALRHAVRLGFRRVVVFPYFLFTGILVNRIYDAVDRVAADFPEIEFVKARYLRDHPQVVETMIDRVQEILQGTGNMNCQMCKYRVQVLGFEAERGLPQESHHHHVEGIGTGAAGHDHGHDHHHHDHAHDHDHHHDHQHGHGHDHGHDHGHHHHGAGHDHGHHHHPYPHADHPLGPSSLNREASSLKKASGG